MNRIFLALLALLGCIAQLGPAQARVGGPSAVAVEVGLGEARAARPRAVRPSEIAPPLGKDGPCVVIMLRRERNCTPAVMLRIDRARE